MITILLLIVGVIFISAVSALLFNVAHAPEGYEDAAGFHFGKEHGLAQKRHVVSKTRHIRSSTRPAGLPLPAV